MLVFKPQFLQQIDRRVLEEGLDYLVLGLGTGERRCVRTSKKARYVSSEKHDVDDSIPQRDRVVAGTRLPGGSQVGSGVSGALGDFVATLATMWDTPTKLRRKIDNVFSSR
jgi:hypothetical protein